MNATTPAKVAEQDQELAQAIHEADMIAEVYVRLAVSLPKNFARRMTERWWSAATQSDVCGCAFEEIE